MYTVEDHMLYTSTSAHSLHDGTQAWPGTYQVVRVSHDRKLYLNIDTSGATFYRDGSLVIVVAKILGHGSLDEHQ